MMNTRYQIALTRIPMVGPVIAKNLISYCGSPAAVFEESKKALLKIPGVGQRIASQIVQSKGALNESDEIIELAERFNIRIIFYLDEAFPKRLYNIPDSPLILYAKGDFDLNHERIVSMIGTRSPSAYGREMAEKLVQDLAKQDIKLISGLAYGIDIAAHQAALQNQVPTIGVLGSGIGRIYPHAHRHIATRMINQNGGLLTEFEFRTAPDRENFPMRNRLIAGLSDAVIVVESARKGGSMITAELANGYHKDVFALPGRPIDPQSLGCNQLIKENKAHLIESGDDIAHILRWKELKERKAIQRKIFVELDDKEKLIAETIQAHNEIEIDQISHLTMLQMSELATVLLSLEFKGLIKALPGKKFRCLQ